MPDHSTVYPLRQLGHGRLESWCWLGYYRNSRGTGRLPFGDVSIGGNVSQLAFKVRFFHSGIPTIGPGHLASTKDVLFDGMCDCDSEELPDP